MTHYIELVLLAVTVTYVVDASGFTQSWRGALARWIGTTEERLRPLPPFDCAKCAVWWSCLVLAIVQGLTWLTLAECAGLSLLATPAGELMNAVRDKLSEWIGKI